MQTGNGHTLGHLGADERICDGATETPERRIEKEGHPEIGVFNVYDIGGSRKFVEENTRSCKMTEIIV